MAGRGVFATSPIPTHEWLCEYKGLVYPQKDLCRYLKEYETSGEGSYVITSAHAVRDMGRLCWDATRHYHQVGRYINHSKSPNARTTTPAYVREKWRIGFISVREIKVGEEILWDYGVQGEEERAVEHPGLEVKVRSCNATLL